MHKNAFMIWTCDGRVEPAKYITMHAVINELLWEISKDNMLIDDSL